MTILTTELVQLLGGCSSASVSTQLVKRGFNNTAIRGVAPLNPDGPRMVGEAFTVRYIPAREDLDGYGSGGDPKNQQRRAIEEIGPGQVMVFDCRGNADAAGIGAILARRVQARGAKGVVLDGGVRDTRVIREFDIPVYCKSPSAPANYVEHHAADFQTPIACGGVAVYPGDIIFGDGEAVICIPRHIALEVATEAAAMEDREKFLLLEIEAGRSIVGVYPPDEGTMSRYAEWRQNNSVQE